MVVAVGVKSMSKLIVIEIKKIDKCYGFQITCLINPFPLADPNLTHPSKRLWKTLSQ